MVRAAKLRPLLPPSKSASFKVNSIAPTVGIVSGGGGTTDGGGGVGGSGSTGGGAAGAKGGGGGGAAAIITGSGRTGSSSGTYSCGGGSRKFRPMPLVSAPESGMTSIWSGVKITKCRPPPRGPAAATPPPAAGAGRPVVGSKLPLSKAAWISATSAAASATTYLPSPAAYTSSSRTTSDILPKSRWVFCSARSMETLPSVPVTMRSLA